MHNDFLNLSWFLQNLFVVDSHVHKFNYKVYSAIKRNKVLMQQKTQMNFEVIMLGIRSLLQKDYTRYEFISVKF